MTVLSHLILHGSNKKAMTGVRFSSSWCAFGWGNVGERLASRSWSIPNAD